jgi:phosphate uptake regulator
LRNAEDLKAEGNDYFRTRQWDQALVTYRTALGELPKRRPEKIKPSPSREFNDDLDENDSNQSSPNKTDEQSVDDESQALSEEEKLCAKARAILNANIGACYVQLVRTTALLRQAHNLPAE